MCTERPRDLYALKQGGLKDCLVRVYGRSTGGLVSTQEHRAIIICLNQGVVVVVWCEFMVGGRVIYCSCAYKHRAIFVCLPVR